MTSEPLGFSVYSTRSLIPVSPFEGIVQFILKRKTVLIPSLHTPSLLLPLPFISALGLICLCVCRLFPRASQQGVLFMCLCPRLWANQDFTGAARGERCAGAFLNRESQGGLMCVQEQDHPTWLLSAPAMPHWTTMDNTSCYISKNCWCINNRPYKNPHTCIQRACI